MGSSFFIEGADLTGDGKTKSFCSSTWAIRAAGEATGCSPSPESGWRLLDAPHEGFSLALEYAGGVAKVSSGG